MSNWRGFIVNLPPFEKLFYNYPVSLTENRKKICKTCVVSGEIFVGNDAIIVLGGKFS